jgi:hypothetical protein
MIIYNFTMKFYLTLTPSLTPPPLPSGPNSLLWASSGNSTAKIKEDTRLFWFLIRSGWKLGWVREGKRDSKHQGRGALLFNFFRYPGFTQTTREGLTSGDPSKVVIIAIVPLIFGP